MTCAALMTESLLLDCPVTALVSGGDHAVYFAAGNTVYKSSVFADAATRASSVAPQLPSLATVRCVSAPPSAAITTLAVVPGRGLGCALGSEEDAVSKAVTLIFIGAADRLLVHAERQDAPACQASASAAPGAPPLSPAFQRTHDAQEGDDGCVCVLHTEESRILCICADAFHQCVVVLTASNTAFILRLADVEAALGNSRTTGYDDVSKNVRSVKLSGPALGVVLAADVLVNHEGSISNAAEDSPCLAQAASYRFFAATYAGEVVEWRAADVPPPLPEKNDSTAVPSSSSSMRTEHGSHCVVARVHAHPSGCAIFSVRVTQTCSVNNADTSSQSGSATCSYLATCSDDRSVAVYERCSSREGETAMDSALLRKEGEAAPWTLLWRGSGAAFSKSRVFDVAVHAAWSLVTETAGATAQRCCSVYVGAAGEDGCVQVHRIRRVPGASAEQRDAGGGGGARLTPTEVSPLLVRPRQHRGHGAYRVAFCRHTVNSLTLLSAGFDGTVFAHAWGAESEGLPSEQGRCYLALDTAAPALHHAVPLQRAHQPTLKSESTARSEQLVVGAKAAQVRVVHVDALGNLLACTSHHLFVRHRDAAAAATARSPWAWQLPSAQAAVPSNGPLSHSPSEGWGLPTAVETLRCASLSVCFHQPARAANTTTVSTVCCAVVGTTTGALYMLPYASARADTEASQVSVERQAAAVGDRDSAHTLPHVVASLREGLQYGKVTQMAVLEVEGDATDQTLAVTRAVLATNHVRHAVVLSVLHLTASASPCEGSASSAFAAYHVGGTMHALSVLSGCPGPLVTALTLAAHPRSPPQSLRFWLFVGDKDGRLLATCCDASERESTLPSPQEGDSAAPAVVPIEAAAVVQEHVFAAPLRIAVSAVSMEEAGEATAAQWSAGVVTIAGTGGVVAFRSLPEPARLLSIRGDASNARCVADVPTAGPAAAPKEPLRLPFEVASVLATSERVCVVQSGTTVSVLYRIPTRSSWVLVDSFDDVRAPRLLTARICETAAVGGLHASTAGQGTAPVVVYVAHCSDGHTVEVFQSTPDAAAVGAEASQPSTSLLHGAGFPGKDYNCVAVLPAPFHCVLLGNEDSSLAVLPLPQRMVVRGGASPVQHPYPQHVPSQLHRCLAPLNVCGAHHSNILAIAVLPPCRSSPNREGALFVSVGGGAMVNLWSCGLDCAPLKLVDWWCGGLSAVPKSPAPHVDSLLGNKWRSTEVSGTSHPTNDAVSASGGITSHHASSAAFQKRRAKQALASASSSALAERVARFMCVTAWDTSALAVGSSDGTLLVFSIRGESTAKGDQEDGAHHTQSALKLDWQGSLNKERPKPILCATSCFVADQCAASAALVHAAAVVLVAGDTNGVVYVFDPRSHTLLGQRRLEQSAVNALSEIHSLPPPADVPIAGCVLQFAAVHDSGVVHLVQMTLTGGTNDAAGSGCLATLSVVSSLALGLTAGRSVRWPAVAQPLVAVSEERVVCFDPAALRVGRLRVLCERRVNVRCVSGAAVIPSTVLCEGTDRHAACGGDADEGPLPPLPQVAVVGQGLELTR